jgi:hypothetical protein
MLLNTSVASELVKAILLEYSFCKRLLTLTILRMTKEMMGVRIRMKSVSFQLSSQRRRRLPKNWRKFRRRMEMLSVQAEYTVPISFPSRESSSPVLLVS